MSTWKYVKGDNEDVPRELFETKNQERLVWVTFSHKKSTLDIHRDIHSHTGYLFLTSHTYTPQGRNKYH